MYDLPVYVWALVLTGVIGIPLATCLAVYSGGTAVGLSRRRAVAIAGTGAAVWAGWLVVSALLATNGVFRQDSTAIRPWFGLAFAGTLAAVLLATRIPVISRILTDPGTVARLVLPHTFRVVGVAFLLVMALGKLPPLFALPAGLGDIAIGVAAPFVARRAIREQNVNGLRWFNVMGMVDLAVAVSIGYLGTLGPFSPLPITPPTSALALLPLSLVPLTAVPLAITLHVVSLANLRAASRRAETPTRTVPITG